MLMIIGFILLAVGVWRASVLYFQMYQLPKMQADIVSKEMKTGLPPLKKKQHPFAKVNYQFEEKRFENEEIALKIDAQIGEQVTLLVDPSNPKDGEQYPPKKGHYSSDHSSSAWSRIGHFFIFGQSQLWREK